LGAFLAVALEWRAQARNAVLQAQTLQALETRVAALEEEKKTLGRQNEAYQTTLKQAQESKAEAEGQLTEAVELQADFYAREVALKVQVTSLQDIAEAYEEVQKDLKARCCEQADEMERMEGEMATQAKAIWLQRRVVRFATGAQPARVNETTTGRKKPDGRRPYEARKPQPRGTAGRDRPARERTRPGRTNHPILMEMVAKLTTLRCNHFH